MLSPTNRIVAILYAVVGIGLFAIAYSGAGMNSRIAYALQILIATGGVVVAVQGLFLRDITVLLVAAGIAIEAYGLFNSQRVVMYVGMILFVSAFLLVMRKYKNKGIPRPTGV